MSIRAPRFALFKARGRAGFAFLVLVAVGYGALSHRFYRAFVFPEGQGTVYGTADDVYIAASFGRTLVEGHGAVWYPGAPRVEGFTSPLWMLISGLLQRMPGFREDALGLYLLALNVLLLAALVAVFVRILVDALSATGRRPARVWLALPIMLGGGSLAYWAADGFEVILVALLALLGFWLARQPLTPRRAVSFGLVVGLAVWTRIDAIVALVPTCVWVAVQAREQRRSRDLARAAAVALALTMILFVVRRAYYGDWLPNTYYLKATGWPLADRLGKGLTRDAPLLPGTLIVGLLVLSPTLRRVLGGEWRSVAVCFVIFMLSVAYSVHNGGDSWQLKAGHDRYTVVGSVFLMLGLALVVLRVGDRAAAVFATVLLATGVATASVVLEPGWRAFHAANLLAVRPPLRSLERAWMEYGKRFAEVSRPGARIAVCPAGAIVYFSHRGGVNLLGKVEPYVAHLPAATTRPPGAYCWRDVPGHNKEDVAGVFRLREPDFSRYPPPPGFEARYYELRYGQDVFYVRKDTSFLRPPAETGPGGGG